MAPVQRQLATRFQDPLHSLDFQKIKDFLLNFDEEIKVSATLQALRWRLTKTKRKQAVKLVIYSYQHFDLLGCAPDARPQIINQLLRGPRKVLEYTMTFVNALASECLGRSYLLQKQDLVAELVKILHSETTDTNLRQCVLGTLQKFSLRRKPQSIMI